MNKEEMVLIGLVPAGDTFHSPVQVQKLFFLLDKNIPMDINGPHFDFQPYNYGPFDKTIYNILEGLEQKGFVEIRKIYSWREYRLTKNGFVTGNVLFNKLPERARDYISRVSKFVRELTFTQLVSSIYKAYPDMKANSVFQE